MALVIAGCQHIGKNDRSLPDGWQVSKDEEYTVYYPGDWNLHKPGPVGAMFIVYSPQTSLQDTFRENVTLLRQDLSKLDINLDRFTAISEEQIRNRINNSSVLESKRLHANGSDFHKVIYTGDQGSYRLKIEQYYWIHDGHAYVLTLTCDSAHFDHYQEVGEKILNHFSLD
jgi:hypothetical protein